MWWLLRRVWFPTLTTLMFWGGRNLDIDWPTPVVALAVLAGAVAAALASVFLVHVTRNIEPGYRAVEVTLLAAGWLMSVAIVVFLAARDPLAGAAAGGLLLFVGSAAFPRHTERLIRFLRPAETPRHTVPTMHRRPS